MSQPYIGYEKAEVRYSELVYGLREATLSIDRGEFVFFVGKTGAGKSTLLKLLSREVGNTAGRVTFAGRDLTNLPDRLVPSLRRQMGIVPQDFALLPPQAGLGECRLCHARSGAQPKGRPAKGS